MENNPDSNIYDQVDRAIDRGVNNIMKKNILMIVVFIFIIPVPLCCSSPRTNETIILNETFDYPDGKLPSDWWSEGNTAIIRDGRLFVDADETGPYRASTIWYDCELSGNLTIEFDAQIVSSSVSVNNINNFLFYSHPSGKSLRETKNEREDAAYPKYHKLNGYIYTYVRSDNQGRFRFRDNPGFNLLIENFGFESETGKTYRIKIIRKDNKFQYWVDGIKILEKILDQNNFLYEKGKFGFRTFRTVLWWDNLVITQLD